MPIDFKIDPLTRTVFARATGRVSAADLYSYQQTVWTRPEVQSYNELTDLSEVSGFVNPSALAIKNLADDAVLLDPKETVRKVAIVAPTDLTFGIARMYEMLRAVNLRSRTRVSVFRELAEAQRWLESDLHSDGTVEFT